MSKQTIIQNVIKHSVEGVDKTIVLRAAMLQPKLLVRELNNRSFYEFLVYFWPEVSGQTFKPNWHVKYLCDELQKIAENLADGKPKLYDLIVNIPPGTTKTIITSIMFPAWCWTRWYWMKFICISYSAVLSLESAEYCRDLVRSDRYKMIYPDIQIKEDKDTKSNFRIVKVEQLRLGKTRKLSGGNRYSTSVGGTLTGFHGHILIWDDPINPQQAVSPTELETANRWLDQTLPTRKVDKAVSVTIGIMQRLHQNDPTGHMLEKKKENIKHICLPGEIDNYADKVKPASLKKFYVDGLLDPVRLNREVLKDLEADLGQYSYAGQIGQFPTPPSGGMFKVDNFIIAATMPNPVDIIDTVRYWDKAGTKENVGGRKTKSAWTVGCKMLKLRNGRWMVLDIKRGRWSTEERERIIKNCAETDGDAVRVFYEQEPGSGGKESAEATTRNLAGFTAKADRPQGDKVYRADPYSVQVNDGNISLLQGDWNYEFIEEHRHFPNSTYKDQVDAAAGAFAKLTSKRMVVVW